MHIKPKKSLGQNFLTDKNILKKIISACGFDQDDLVLEIGSGRGQMTGLIAPQVKRLFAVELDERLYPLLEQELGAFKNTRVIKADILKFDLAAFLSQTAPGKKIKVIGNIPYYISSPILEHLIGQRDHIREVFITVQKEFGRRVVSPPGSKEYGSLSCFVQYYFSPEILFEIKRNSFTPCPKVDSVFLKLITRSTPPVKVEDEQDFFKLIRLAFNQRRKTLKNSLAGAVPEASLKEFFIRFGLDPAIRPERLGLADFANLANLVKKS